MSTTPGIKLTCTAEGCERRTVARRLCRAHYQAAWKAGELANHEPAPPREKAPTRCPETHKHAEGSTCYIQHQCRCGSCVDEHTRRSARRRRLQAYGRWDTGLVDAAPVREHILMLGEYGIGYKRVAELAGVGVTGVRTLVWGRQDPGRRNGEIPKRVSREKAARILAVEARVENLGARRPVPALGAQRRIQALVTQGWSLTKIAGLIDMELSNMLLMLQRANTSASTHLRVAEVYERLWNVQPPHDEWRSRGAYTRSVNYAHRHGWLPPFAWDDIDTDPAPEAEVVTQGRATGEEILDDIEFLLDAGESPEQVAKTVGRKIGAISKLAERHGRQCIANLYGALDRRIAA